MQDLGFWVSDFGFRGQDSKFRVQGSGFRIQGLEFRVKGSGVRVSDSGFRFRVLGFGFRVSGVGVRVITGMAAAIAALEGMATTACPPLYIYLCIYLNTDMHIYIERKRENTDLAKERERT